MPFLATLPIYAISQPRNASLFVRSLLYIQSSSTAFPLILFDTLKRGCRRKGRKDQRMRRYQQAAKHHQLTVQGIRNQMRWACRILRLKRSRSQLSCRRLLKACHRSRLLIQVRRSSQPFQSWSCKQPVCWGQFCCFG
jgi:hypothetical protein